MDIQGRWFYGLVAHSLGYGDQPKEKWCISNSVGSPWAYQVRPETVEQFIGKYDIAKNEIYHNDILEKPDGRRCRVIWLDNSQNACWDLIPVNCLGEPPGDGLWNAGWKIVGNIHEGEGVSP